MPVTLDQLARRAADAIDREEAAAVDEAADALQIFENVRDTHWLLVRVMRRLAREAAKYARLADEAEGAYDDAAVRLRAAGRAEFHRRQARIERLTR
jgi:hypothetical protein